MSSELDLRIEKALKINKEKLDDSILEFAEIYNELIKKYLKILRGINDCEIKLQEVFIERYTYYKVDFDIQLNEREIRTFVENDKETIELRKKLLDLKTLSEVTEKQMKNIESCRWDCKNLIDYLKLKSGLI